MTYKLDKHGRVVRATLEELISQKRWQLETTIPFGGQAWVSTVFLALDHPGGLFETMVFGVSLDPETGEVEPDMSQSAWLTRTTTLEKAKENHEATVEHVSEWLRAGGALTDRGLHGILDEATYWGERRASSVDR